MTGPAAGTGARTGAGVGGTTERQWQQQGACAGLTDHWFFHPDNERGHARDVREAAAKLVCERCPVLARCREHALAAREPYGVWGGLGESERRAMLSRRRRDSPVLAAG